MGINQNRVLKKYPNIEIAPNKEEIIVENIQQNTTTTLNTATSLN